MIYCLTSLDTEGNKLYKIGYTDDIKSRMTHYQLHNPSIKLVKVKDGERIDEQCIHCYLHLKGLGKYRREWYVDNKDVKRILSKPMDEIKEFLWENKEKVFSKSKLRSVSWFNLYKKLERVFNKRKLTISKPYK